MSHFLAYFEGSRLILQVLGPQVDTPGHLFTKDLINVLPAVKGRFIPNRPIPKRTS